MPTKNTTTFQPAPPSPNEIALQNTQLDLARKQLSAINQQLDFQQQQFETLGPVLDQQVKDSELARAQAEKLAPIQEELLNLELDKIRQGSKATPEQLDAIGRATDAAIASGEADIERFQTEGNRRLREELASSLGLRPGDTPIVDRGEQIAAEAQRSQGQLVSGLRGAQAQAELNFPLAAGQFEASRAQFQQNLTESTRQFQESLRNQAFLNRLRATGQVGGLGNQLSSIRPQSILFPRGGSTSTTSGLGFADLAGGVGGLFTGLGTIGRGGGFSKIFA